MQRFYLGNIQCKKLQCLKHNSNQYMSNNLSFNLIFKIHMYNFLYLVQIKTSCCNTDIGGILITYYNYYCAYTCEMRLLHRIIPRLSFLSKFVALK